MSRLLKIGLVLLLFLGSAPLMYAQIARTNQATGKSSFNPTNPAEPDAEFKDDGEEDEKEEVVYYEVTVSSKPSSAGNISNGGKFTCGSSIYVYTSLKNSKYKFSHWTLNGDFYSNSQSFTYKIDTVDANFVAHYEFVPSSPVEPSPMPEEPEKPVKKVVPLFLTTNLEGVCTFNQPSGHEYEEDTWVSLEAFVAKGYEFKGWYEGTTLLSKNRTLSYQIPSEASTLIAYVEKIVYNPNNPSEPDGSQDDVAVGSYNLIYVVDGEEYETMLVKFGTSITLLDPLHKEGYTFSGWSEVPTTMPANDIVITGSFSVNSYTVIFKIGEEVIYSKSLPYGSAIVAPEAPEKEGHTFAGWGKVAATVPAGDVTYEGSYTVNTYSVTFKIEGEVIYSESLPYGTAIVAPEAPAKEGHTFAGWGKVAATVPAGDVTYEGSYTINKYTLTFIADGKIVQSGEVAYGAAITAPIAPAKEGHTFAGWDNLPATMPTKAIIVTGNYIVNSYTVTFKIGDEVVVADSLEYGAEIIVPEVPEKEGYTFNGWGEVADVVPAGDVVYEGSYSVNSYLLSYVVDGDTIQTDSVVYGTEITLPAEPTKEGHTFDGWSEVPVTMPASNVTVYGTFTANKYCVTFALGGVVKKTGQLEYGTTIEVPTFPEKEGYTLTWSEEVPATVPAKDVYYNAVYVVNIYQVYYFVGTDLVHVADVAYGEKIPEYIYEPEEGEEVFLGWLGDEYETMPAHEIYLTAEMVPVGIEKLIGNGEQKTVIYDLQGRRVLNTQNLKGGIYIVNGKKVVLK